MRLADLNLNKATPLDRRSSSSEADSNLSTLYGATASGLYRSGRDGPESINRNQSFVIRSAMRRILESIYDLRPALLGTAGTGATVILDGVNAAVGILVGLATLIYLVIRIRKELRK